MNNLISYLQEQKISFIQLSDTQIEIDNKTYELIYPNEEGKLFNEDFILIVESEPCDNYIYNFGGNYYYETKDSVVKPRLNKLKYLGRCSDKLPTESFLGIHSGYELLNGQGLFEDWCKKAKFLGVKTLGIIEKNSLAGIMKFQLECQANNIKPILGATYTVVSETDRYDLKFYVKGEVGWHNLLMINKEVNVINRKFIYEKDLKDKLDDLIIVLDPKSSVYEKIPKLILESKPYYQLDTVKFEDEERDKNYLINLKKYVDSTLKPISITDAYYIDKEYSYIKQKLNAISEKREYISNNQYFKNKQDYYNELEQLFNIEDDRLFGFFETAIGNEHIIISECNFILTTKIKHLPEYIMSDKEKSKFSNHEDLFWNIIEFGLKKRVSLTNQELYLDRVCSEFETLKEGGFIDYFLIAWDLMKWCRENDILTGISRGSVGGSLISYLMSITHIDPIQYDLPFERFFNKGRLENGKVPDADLDVQGDRREEVKKYLEYKYGKEQVCSIGTYTTLQVKQGVKDLSRIHNLNVGYVNQVTTSVSDKLDDKLLTGFFKESLKNKMLYEFIQENPELINELGLILKQPRSSSIHACATLILPKEKDVYSWCPVRIAEEQNKKQILVAEWEGNELEEIGLLKEDVLGLEQLTKFKYIIDLIKKNKGAIIDIYSLPLDDKKTIMFFKNGWNNDVFQFGAKGLSKYCKQLSPNDLEDLIAAVSLYRPGTMESNLHNEYILRKNGEREVEYDWKTEDITKNTYGILVYQEQILRVCVAVGGFNLSEADDIRVAMGKKKKSIIDNYKIQFIDGAKNNEYTQEKAEELWDKLEKFAGYSFNKAHAAAYAITGYISQWLKVNYPIEFWTIAFSNNENDKIPNFISEINTTGDIKISPPDINNSFTDTTSNFELNTIYWSLTSIKQCGDITVNQIMKDREENGKYFSFEEFLSRSIYKGSKVNKSTIENLILSGAFDTAEDIRYPSERHRLIKYYRTNQKIKVDKTKDFFETNQLNLIEDWWWSLQQKKLSGLSKFDYLDLCDRYISNGSKFIEPQDYQSTTLHYTTHYKTGGVISEAIVRRSKNKGEYASLKLETNFSFLWITIFPEQFKQFKEAGIDLQQEGGNILLISGNIVSDSYKKENVLRMNSESSFILLK